MAPVPPAAAEAPDVRQFTPSTVKHPALMAVTTVEVPPEMVRLPAMLRLVVVADVPVALVKKSAVAVRAVVEA